MSKQISPMFTLIVIVAALALGAIYFMHRYRAYEIQWQREAAALQAQAENARRSGRGAMRGRSGMGTRRGSAGRAAPGSAKPGAPKPTPGQQSKDATPAPATK